MVKRTYYKRTMKICCSCLNEWGKRIMHTWAPPRGCLKTHHQRVQNGQKSSLFINFWRFKPVSHGAAFVSGEEFPRQTLGAVWVWTFLCCDPAGHLSPDWFCRDAVLMRTPGRWGRPCRGGMLSAGVTDGGMLILYLRGATSCPPPSLSPI